MKVAKLFVLFTVICSTLLLPLQAQQTQPQPTGTLSQGATTQPVNTPAGLDVANGTMTVRREYLLGPNDVIDLRVFGEPQFDGAFTVDPDGKLTVPFVEEPLMAQCRSVKDISKEVKVALAKFLKKPQVYMSIKEQRSRPPATVYGAVRTPARYEMHRPARLLELLGQSGGVTEQRSGTIQIFHTQPVMCSEEGEMPVVVAPPVADNATDALSVPFTVYNVDDLKVGKAEANPYINPGGIIFVAEASPIYITGSVAQPTSLYLRDQMTLSRALAIVGGPRNARESQVRIYRQKPGMMKQDTLTVDYKAIKQGKKEDVALQPYDIIEVPENGVWSAKGVSKMLTGFVTGGAGNFLSQAPLRILY